MIWLERKYINQLAPYLRNFKWKKTNTANCSCPVCGDSSTNKTKARFYFLERRGRYHAFCHNCGYSHPFTVFLSEQNNTLYTEYLKEAALEKYSEKPQSFQEVREPKIKTKLLYEPLSMLHAVSRLPSTHKARLYCDGRHIPLSQQSRLYYAPEFMAWTNGIIPDKFIFTKDEDRLIIPLLKQNGDLFAFQGRSLNPDNKLRYITITIDDDYPKLFGLERVDFTKKYYVFEGPIDSLFIPNAIAMAGSDVEDNDIIGSDAVFVLDNQPRNRDVIKKYQKLIKKNHLICIWPNDIEFKDVNDMILGGHTSEEIKQIIDDNTVQGLEALLRLNDWKRVAV